MHRHLPLRLLFSFILISAGIVHSLENQAVQPQGQIKSLRDLCIQTIVRNAQKVELIDNLPYLPDNCAVDAVLSTDSDWTAEDENHTMLIELVKSNKLDMAVACAIAQKLNNVELAYDVAKKCRITDGVASLIVDAFIATDITTCLSDFNSAFAQLFSADILQHNNVDIFYKLLMSKISLTIDGNVYAAPTRINNGKFSMDDFQIRLSNKAFE